MDLATNLLALDLGNSRLKAAFLVGEKITNFSLESSDLEKNLGSLFKEISLCGKLQGIILCSVQPSSTENLCKEAKKAFGLEPVIVDQILLEKLGLKTETVGAGNDRLATAYGLWLEYRQNLLIADFGTAITLDAINLEGEFLGGSISPGLKLCAEALKNETAQLFEVPLEPPKEVIGKNTTQAMQSGIILGNAYMTKCLAEKFARHCACDFYKIVTGGSVKLVHPYLGEEWDAQENATILALKNIYTAVKGFQP
ncbi:MAG: type III pantothenate kinase [SAR324 cluster bacterium]|nr:type III pantothenate kinase [SAR324 cluster bacterium]